ncbi:hypothetical protein L873DRAFT_1324042 [Choiromyces venosus 120613-1]|uniref:Uncharacterized protein n=1 Tax=Choiromyces venosus 120613-1 TaxID=1336337 RepID=A0A3N4JAK5_9PEZI|nr:hypothetical protein L873DRAFT_1324042 [Choiromyces venosus 120613-1]
MVMGGCKVLPRTGRKEKKKSGLSLNKPLVRSNHRNSSEPQPLRTSMASNRTEISESAVNLSRLMYYWIIICLFIYYEFGVLGCLL